MGHPISFSVTPGSIGLRANLPQRTSCRWWCGRENEGCQKESLSSAKAEQAGAPSLQASLDWREHTSQKPHRRAALATPLIAVLPEFCTPIRHSGVGTALCLWEASQRDRGGSVMVSVYCPCCEEKVGLRNPRVGQKLFCPHCERGVEVTGIDVKLDWAFDARGRAEKTRPARAKATRFPCDFHSALGHLGRPGEPGR